MKIKQPTLVIDEQKVRQNIRKMKVKADYSGAVLRPHFKTHHSTDIAQWFKEEGISQITCSSVSMAEYFASNGWEDITIAFPYNPLEYEEIDLLASRIKLNILIESKETLDHIIKNVKNELGVFLKIDLGTHRTGILPKNKKLIAHLLKTDYQKHKLKGVLGHAGHSYKPLTKAEAQNIYDESLEIFRDIQSMTDKSLHFSYGDTPTCSLLDHFTGMDEIRAGNFAFYDVMQHSFNACKLSEIGVAMLCPIVAIHPERNEAVIYGGGVHFSKDHIVRDNKKYFGTVVQFDGNHWEDLEIASLSRISQEHGIISGDHEYISSLKIGDLVCVLPIHSCLTADLQGYYLALEGHKLQKQNRSC